MHLLLTILTFVLMGVKEEDASSMELFMPITPSSKVSNSHFNQQIEESARSVLLCRSSMTILWSGAHLAVCHQLQSQFVMREAATAPA